MKHSSNVEVSAFRVQTITFEYQLALNSSLLSYCPQSFARFNALGEG